MQFTPLLMEAFFKEPDDLRGKLIENPRHCCLTSSPELDKK